MDSGMGRSHGMQNGALQHVICIYRVSEAADRSSFNSTSTHFTGYEPGLTLQKILIIFYLHPHSQTHLIPNTTWSSKSTITTTGTEYYESKICGKIEKLNQLNYLRWVTQMHRLFTATQCLPIVLGEEPSNPPITPLTRRKHGRSLGTATPNGDPF